VSFKCKKYQIYVTSSEVDSEYKHVYQFDNEIKIMFTVHSSCSRTDWL